MASTGFESCIKPVVITHSTQDTLVSLTGLKRTAPLLRTDYLLLVPQSAAAGGHFPLITQANN